jgi:enterochelin esterase family protein
MKIVFTFLALATATVAAQDRPAPIVSPEVQNDGHVIFRLRAPQAHEVSVSGEWGPAAPMTRDASGIWTATVGPLHPDLYGYGFVVDGLRILDPANTAIKPMRSNSTSILDLPGAKPAPCDRQPAVSHGTVHLHDYDSKSLGRVRRLRVYTPPNYESDRQSQFPSLYLLHGSGDNEATWTELGRAHVILDNLLAAKAIVPMVVIMTDGHAVAPGGPDRSSNTQAFQRDLLEDVMPFVAAHYRLLNDRESRAIIGLSMGGGQSLGIGLTHLDQFAWIGGMSSAVRDPEKTLEKFLAAPEQSNAQLRLLWFACGKDDFLLKANQAFDALLTTHKIQHEFVETEGNHSWPVWRRHLTTFAPRIFQTAR